MSNLNDLDDVTISEPLAGDVIKYTADGWVNALMQLLVVRGKPLW